MENFWLSNGFESRSCNCQFSPVAALLRAIKWSYELWVILSVIVIHTDYNRQETCSQGWHEGLTYSVVLHGLLFVVGLGHQVRQHDVQLARRFVTHLLPQKLDSLGQKNLVLNKKILRLPPPWWIFYTLSTCYTSHMLHLSHVKHMYGQPHELIMCKLITRGKVELNKILSAT